MFNIAERRHRFAFKKHEQDASDSLIIAATNHPAILDRALFRRFDDIVQYGLPSAAEIQTALKFKLSGSRISSKINWVKLASTAKGLSYADVTRATTDALKHAVIEGRTVSNTDLLVAISERKQLSRGVVVLGIIAEVRKAKITAAFFSTLNAAEQHALADGVVARLGQLAPNAPAVGLLDTGVNHAHPLLAPVIADGDVQALKFPWGGHDTHPHGHGTQMAGLAIYGDLTEILSGGGPIELTHGVQSVKLIHAPDAHLPELYR
jgi:hypothetical protein